VLLLRALGLAGEMVHVPKPNEEFRHGHSTSNLELVHQRLANPIALVAEHFVLASGSQLHDVATLSVQKDVMEMFPDSTTEPQRRLRVGFVDDDDDGPRVRGSRAGGNVPFRIIH
jgi:hypothetical protein